MAAVVGFYGKIPSRGDFVRWGLPSSFVEPWDAWLQTVLPAAREALGDDWDAIWLEAPVWHFLLPPGQCGPAGVLGLWMPSVDAIGRHFPLTLATVLSDDEVPRPGDANAWLDYVEQTGRDAIAYDLSPDDLVRRLSNSEVAVERSAETRLGRWWTEGAPYVPATRLELSKLPGLDVFASIMLVTRDSN